MDQDRGATADQPENPTYADLRQARIEADSSAGHRLDVRYGDGRMPVIEDLPPAELLWADIPTVPNWSTAGPRQTVKPLAPATQTRIDAMIASWGQFYGAGGNVFYRLNHDPVRRTAIVVHSRNDPEAPNGG